MSTRSPTADWTTVTSPLHDSRWAGWHGWWVLDTNGIAVQHGRERTKPEAQEAARAALDSWHHRLTGTDHADR